MIFEIFKIKDSLELELHLWVSGQHRKIFVIRHFDLAMSGKHKTVCSIPHENDKICAEDITPASDYLGPRPRASREWKLARPVRIDYTTLVHYTDRRGSVRWGSPALAPQALQPQAACKWNANAYIITITTVLTEMQRLTTCAAKGSIFSTGMPVHKPNYKAQRVRSSKSLSSYQSGYITKKHSPGLQLFTG